MSLFKRPTEEELRGIEDAKLPSMADMDLVMLSLAILMRGVGIDDSPLIGELEQRSGVEYETQP